MGIVVFDDKLGTSTYNTVFETKRMGAERLNLAYEFVNSLLVMYKPELVVIEGYAFGARGSMVFSIGELGGVLRLLLYQKSIKTVEIPPTTLKKFVCGKGNVKKNILIKEVYKKWGIDFDDDNLADAYGLARIGSVIVNKSKLKKYERESLKNYL